jgi:hypothetical protein
MSDPVPTKPKTLELGDVTDIGKIAIRLGVTSAATLEAVEIAASAVTVISTITTVVGAALAILGALGVFSRSDSVEQKINTLLADFQALFAEQEAQGKILLMRDVAIQIEDARTQENTLRSSSPDDPNFVKEHQAVLNDTDRVVRTLGNIGFWLRPFFQDAVYFDEWSNFLTPPRQSPAEVFDYRLTLPAFLEAIMIRLAVLVVLVPNFRESHKAELSEMASRLEGFFNTIRDGITNIPTPHPFPAQDIFYREALASGEPLRTQIIPSRWDVGGRLYGAVERYSAVAVVDQYPTDRFPNAQEALFIGADVQAFFPSHSQKVPSSEVFNRFLVQHAMGTLARRQAVYRVVGLPAVKTALNLLKDLAGEPRPQPGPDGNWSLREVDNTVATILLGKPSTSEPHTPIHVFPMLSLLMPFGGTPRTVRQALNFASD